MRIKDKLDYNRKSKPFTLTADAFVKEALDEMCDKNFGSVVIVDEEEKVIGIVTERDMMRRVLHKGLDPKITAIKEVMSTTIRTANENDTLVDWIRIMSTERFRHLPIVDDHGTLIGMMSQGDFVSHTWPDLFEHLRRTVKERLGMPLQLMMIVVSLVIIGILVLEKLG